MHTNRHTNLYWIYIIIHIRYVYQSSQYNIVCILYVDDMCTIFVLGMHIVNMICIQYIYIYIYILYDMHTKYNIVLGMHIRHRQYVHNKFIHISSMYNMHTKYYLLLYAYWTQMTCV